MVSFWSQTLAGRKASSTNLPQQPRRCCGGARSLLPRSGRRGAERGAAPTRGTAPPRPGGGAGGQRTRQRRSCGVGRSILGRNSGFLGLRALPRLTPLWRTPPGAGRGWWRCRAAALRPAPRPLDGGAVTRGGAGALGAAGMSRKPAAKARPATAAARKARRPRQPPGAPGPGSAPTDGGLAGQLRALGLKLREVPGDG